MTGLNIKRYYWKLNKNLKILKTLVFSKTSHVITTSKWRRRFHSIQRMVLLGIIGLGILILEMLKLLQQVASYLYDGLKRPLMPILTKLWKQIMKIMLLLQTRIQFTLRLRNLLAWSLRKERQMKQSSISWTKLQKRSLNLLLIKVINFSLNK